MRPTSIAQFDRYFLASLALGLINSVLSYRANVALLEADPALAQTGFGSGFVVTVVLFALGIPLLLWYFISRRASNIAKWILVVMTGLGLPLMIPTLPDMAERGGPTLFITVVLTALQLLAISYLFRQDARDWLAIRGRKEPPDASVFD